MLVTCPAGQAPHPLQVDLELLLAEAFAASLRRHLGQQLNTGLLESLPVRTGPVHAVAQRRLQLQAGRLLALLGQLQTVLFVLRTPHHHVHRHAQLVPVEAGRPALPPMPHLGVVH
jgi:hypothetical protein